MAGTSIPDYDNDDGSQQIDSSADNMKQSSSFGALAKAKAMAVSITKSSSSKKTSVQNKLDPEFGENLLDGQTEANS